MAIDNTVSRNVNIYDGHTGDVYGGLQQDGSITESKFLWLVKNILLNDSSKSEGSVTVKARSTGRLVSSTNERLPTGGYDVFWGEDASRASNDSMTL